MQLPLLSAMHQTLEARGNAFVPLTAEPAGAGVRDFLHDAKIELRSYYDDRGEAIRATKNISTPMFYVLDAAGRIRFEGHALALAITEAAALQEQ